MTGDAATRDPSRLVLLVLVFVVVAGAALRFAGLDAQSLWSDELASFEISNKTSLSDVIHQGVRATTYPPGYSVLLYGALNTLGDSEKALRFPSAVAGVLAILAIFFLGRQLYGSREGLIAATLVAFSYQPIYYSQEARAYSLMLLFSIASAHFWFRLFRCLEARRSPPPAPLLGYAACAIFLIYLHYFGLLLVGVQLGGLLALFAMRPRQLAWVAGLSLVVAVSYIPWLPYFFEEFGRQEIYIEPPGLNTLFGYWRFLFYNPGDHLKWFAAAVFAAAAVRWFATRGSAPAAATDPRLFASVTLLLAGWLVLPFALAFAQSYIGLPIITYRNLIISLPAAYLLFARALTQTLGDVRYQGVTVAAMVAVMLYGLFVTGDYYRLPRKEQFREAAAVVVEREDEFANARIIAHAWTKGRFDYYLERLGAESRVDLKAGTEADIERVRGYLAAEDPDHVWFLLGHMQPEPPFIQFLDREYELIFHVPLYRAFVRLYRRPDASR